MASKSLTASAIGLAVAGTTLFVVGMVSASRNATPALQRLAAELDGRLRDAATAAHARGETLASLPSVKDAVSTDAATVRDQTQRERMFRPLPSETITVAQVDHANQVSVLLVLPEGSEPASHLVQNGVRLDVLHDKLCVTDVLAVMPSEPERAVELRGVLALSSAVDLKAFVEHLAAVSAVARIKVGERTLLVGAHVPAGGDTTFPVAVGAVAGRDAHVELVAASSSSFPFRIVGGLMLTLALLLGAIDRRGRPARPLRPDSPQDAIPTLVSLAPSAPIVIAPVAVGAGTIVDGTYMVQELIGQGSMGVVWRARHLRLPKLVAIKFLNAAVHQPEFDVMGRFRREAEITAQLGHPNIVGVVDFNTLPSGTPYIVLEYLEGESLAARIFRGPLPLDEALEYAQQIGSALHAAHRAGVVHRDLKPDNIHLVPTESGTPQVKILDFGISKMKDGILSKTQDAAVFGTPQYMSPEQANGKNSEVDARTDIWALATLVHEMVVGEPAFAGETMTTLLVNMLLKPAPSLRDRSDVPAHVSAALDRALMKNPSERFADVRSFIAALTGAPAT